VSGTYVALDTTNNKNTYWLYDTALNELVAVPVPPRMPSSQGRLPVPSPKALISHFSSWKTARVGNCKHAAADACLGRSRSRRLVVATENSQSESYAEILAHQTVEKAKVLAHQTVDDAETLQSVKETAELARLKVIKAADNARL